MIPIVIAIIATLVIVAPITWLISSNAINKRNDATIGNANEKAREIIDEALKTAETKKKEALLEVKEESLKTKNELEKETKERRAEISKYEKRVLSKEETLDRKIEAVEKRDSNITRKEEELGKQKQKVEELEKKKDTNKPLVYFSAYDYYMSDGSFIRHSPEQKENTGKTTLSTDPKRLLIGDDEHGWDDNGVFNFEGGCYAKVINLDKDSEPDIYNAIKRNALLENVTLDENGKIDFADKSVTENTRVSYPINHIQNIVRPISSAPAAKNVIFLSADAFGVLPPISKLSPDAAMYHFVTGFTSKLTGTERGITEPKPTFSTLFGEPFMPMDPAVYANMLGEKIAKYGTSVYLVNTGWAGGSAQELGKAGRMKLRYTRAMVTAALNGELANAEYEHSEIFNVEMPKAVTGCPSEILNPETMWIANGKTKEDYVAAANNLANMFSENFAKKYPNMPKNIAEAGPKAK